MARMIDGKVFQESFIQEILAELRHAVIMASANLHEPTPCQRLAVHLLHDTLIADLDNRKLKPAVKEGGL